MLTILQWVACIGVVVFIAYILFTSQNDNTTTPITKTTKAKSKKAGSKNKALDLTYFMQDLDNKKDIPLF